MARSVDPLETMPVSRYARPTALEPPGACSALLILFLYLPIAFMVIVLVRRVGDARACRSQGPTLHWYEVMLNNRQLLRPSATRSPCR